MKMTLFVAMATLAPGVFLMQANGGATVAVIDFDRTVGEAPGGKDAITKLTTLQSEQIAAITAKPNFGNHSDQPSKHARRRPPFLNLGRPYCFAIS